MKDNHGVEIYEGDIVQKYVIEENGTFEVNGSVAIGTHQVRATGIPFEVKWQEQQCGFGITKGNKHFYVLVGNIHKLAPAVYSC